ncbi:hypothetical protein [Halorubrum vacuolatum]|uniref:Uncharacterized protein n=1 Tax=Halorubrum vacuolatum TaxID=63740 RepID=A0A238UUW4_HALVU|nr:hypothetical protein [Halorubrum vacuolatum]SNR25995.1 hypothetical protein SAMN06264855_101430 [Halorubrum vacuolatum]
MTDDADADATAHGDPTRRTASVNAATDAGEADRPTDRVASETPDDDRFRPSEDIDFSDLSLPQRVFVAALQNPMRGVFILILFAFAFSFYIAFWMVFPQVAAFISALGLVLIAILIGIYYVLDRVT